MNHSDDDQKAQDEEAKCKQKNRGKKRKRVASESSTDIEDVLPENTLEVEKNLHASAIKNNLDDVSVKKILKTKGKALTKEETRVLLDLVEASKVITSKATNTSSNKLKTVEWRRLTDRFNTRAVVCSRTPAQLRLKWENLKKNARRRTIKLRMCKIMTDAGPGEYNLPPDDILDRVIGLLGRTASGSSVPFGDDKEDKDDKDNSAKFPLILPVECSSGDCDPLDEIKVVLESQNRVLEQDGSSGGSSGSEVEDMNETTPPERKFTFSTPKVNKNPKNEDSRTARNQAIAEYFIMKKQCLSAKLENINLENKSLNLTNAKLMLEIEKLKLELEKLRQQ